MRFANFSSLLGVEWAAEIDNFLFSGQNYNLTKN